MFFQKTKAPARNADPRRIACVSHLSSRRHGRGKKLFALLGPNCHPGGQICCGADFGSRIKISGHPLGQSASFFEIYLLRLVLGGLTPSPADRLRPIPSPQSRGRSQGTPPPVDNVRVKIPSPPQSRGRSEGIPLPPVPPPALIIPLRVGFALLGQRCLRRPQDCPGTSQEALDKWLASKRT